ncbi:MAG: hypothetical protein GF355_06240, partial [Candidatus Eisenbacteria bacterium]|nr:hypothetical protein [Candidatus Eisenbacteria bacterium]
MRSRGLTAALSLLFLGGLHSPASSDVFPVTDLGDSGSGTLRQALIDAGDPAGAPHTIVFDVAGAIQPLTPLPPLSVDGTEVHGELDSDGYACSGCDPRILIWGNLTTGSGLVIAAESCSVSGLIIMGFSGPGIELGPDAQWSRVGQPGPECCERVYLTNNATGVVIYGTTPSNNIVQNCRIYNNTGNGVEVLSGPIHNSIGVDADERRNYIYGNGANGVLFEALEFADVENDTIAGNVIYENTDNGILFFGGGNPSCVTRCVITGNKIGIDEDNAAAGNGLDGVRLRNCSPENEITDNLIVHNGHNGINLLESSHQDSVASNYIGIDPDGTVRSNQYNGIHIQTDANMVGPDNVIMHNGAGGTEFNGITLKCGGAYAPGQNTIWSNTIAANTGSGVMMGGVGTVENVVIQNDIGTDAAYSDLGNSEYGVELQGGASLNRVLGNTIGFNTDYGVTIASAADDNDVLGNAIGTDDGGELDLGNGGGILIGSSDNVIGGTTPGDGNVIGFNSGWGIMASAGSEQSGN